MTEDTTPADESDDDEDFGPHCEDISQQHDWSEWEFAEVGTHEVRFCSKCGGMEQQWMKDR